jgi:aminopeptidase N
MIHTLRSYLGDSLFFNGLTAFLDANKFKDVSTTQLRDFMSLYTGINLTHYFDNWITAPGFTHFSIDSTHVLANGGLFETSVFLRQRKHKSSDYYTNVPLEIGFYDAQMNLYVHQLTFTGRCMEFQINLPFEPAMIVVDPNARISDAITEETKIVKSMGLINLPQAKFKAYVKNIVNAADSVLFRVEHSWIAPDRFKSLAAANGYLLCDSRYWKIDAINLTNIAGTLQFNYDGGINNSYLDSAWVKNTEDSIHLFYRKDATEEWQIANDSLKAGVLNDKLGVIFAKEIKAGEYCLGIKKSNYTDPLVTDAPAGGCGIVTKNNEKVMDHAEDIFLFPNPASREISLLFFNTKDKDLKISLYTISGLKVFDYQIKSNETKLNVKLPSLNTGLYYMTITDGMAQTSTVKKLVIQ